MKKETRKKVIEWLKNIDAPDVHYQLLEIEDGIKLILTILIEEELKNE